MAKHDRSTLILAIALALFLWAYVRISHQTPEVTRIMRNVPVRPEGKIASGLAYRLFDESRTVDLQLKGVAERVNNLSRDDMMAYIDVSTLTRSQTAILKPRVPLPHGVRLVNAPKVTLQVFPSRLQSYPVTISYIAQPPPGTTVGEYTTEPSTVTVEGSREALQRVRYVVVRLNPNQLSAAEHDYIPLAIDTEGKEVDGVHALTPTVKVSMASLTGQQTTRQVAVGQPALRNQPRGYTVRVVRIRPEQVTVSGERAQLDLLPAYITTEPIDVHGVHHDTTVTVRLRIPSGVTVVDDPTVRVDLEAQPVE